MSVVEPVEPRPSGGHRIRARTCFLLVGLLLAGCAGSGGPDSVSGARDDVPSLEPEPIGLG